MAADLLPYNPDFIEAVRLACLACFARPENSRQPIMFSHLQDAWDMMNNGDHLRRAPSVATPAPAEATRQPCDHRGWIGVDFDGTLANYDGFRGLDHLGEPVPAMLERVKAWIAEGRDVRIFTARGCRGGDEEMLAYAHLRGWCQRHLGRWLPITRTKDMHMHEMWDDRAVQVVKNTGRRVDEATPAPTGEAMVQMHPDLVDAIEWLRGPLAESLNEDGAFADAIEVNELADRLVDLAIPVATPPAAPVVTEAVPWLQAHLPWTIPYSAEFIRATERLPHLDMQHAMIHVMKSMGKLAAMFDHADHAREHSADAVADVPNLVADLVVCALRMANVSPWGSFDLWTAVLDRIGKRNGVDPAALAAAQQGET